MRIEQRRWTTADGWSSPARSADDAEFVLAFGGTSVLARGEALDEVRRAYPSATVVGCSTAGEIMGTSVTDDTLVTTAAGFSGMRTVLVSADHREFASEDECGRDVASRLDPSGLVHAFVLADGHDVNGSALVRGIESGLPNAVAVSGGLAGDGDRFERTLVVAGDGPAAEHAVGLVGFYGDVEVGFGSLGGWDPFGPMRLVTRSDGNVLYELDGQPALGLYRKYLGQYAGQLPASGLLFPLSVQGAGHDHEVVRTILGVDEEAQSLTFAGDLPEGSYARLMKANFDRLVDGADGAARASRMGLGPREAELAILISCVGRKLVLKQRTEQEIEAVREVLGPSASMTGFYSYGEICPAAPDANCELHNQTMTITTLTER